MKTLKVSFKGNTLTDEYNDFTTVPMGNLYIYVFIFYRMTTMKGLHTGAFLSIGFITNFLSLKEMFLISLHGNPILGVILWTIQNKNFGLVALHVNNGRGS